MHRAERNGAPGPARIAFGSSGPATPDDAGPDRPDAPELGPGDTVDLAAVRRDAGVDDVLDALDRDLVGLAPVKQRLRELAALLVVDRVRARFGLATGAPTLHMCFTGNPGTGKTTVARRMAGLLHGLGYLRTGHLVSATRDDLVGEYVGHTAPKTKETVRRALGGVLFIDEAYYLHRPGNERDYGGEAIEILLQAMEDHRADVAVVLAGYADRMDTFFAANPGMQSRIAHHVDFPDFSVDELAAIGGHMVDELGLVLSDEATGALHEYLELRVEQPWFAGARSVRNALDRARMRQARRLTTAERPLVTRDDLRTLTAADLRASRVFDGGLPR
ncbi:putative Rubsico expression protein CbbX [Pseudonocardia autotrophica]|uniref:Stage V sporulation protein K n=1 Tax=Pseudonocardia autotrophica TaxID=2074 RepID=A0A1Y2N7S6_PSEAH|nr:AAA family ATPase [Pseudonocardia autotrophica]OSY43503.1 Stage V sporulation protein K [Pseudonocardia autotrophica]TDN73503.1 putative Rubsico expression protein CbbX [Pseudonocardia autotrophica]